MKRYFSLCFLFFNILQRKISTSNFLYVILQTEAVLKGVLFVQKNSSVEQTMKTLRAAYQHTDQENSFTAIMGYYNSKSGCKPNPEQMRDFLSEYMDMDSLIISKSRPELNPERIRDFLKKHQVDILAARMNNDNYNNWRNAPENHEEKQK